MSQKEAYKILIMASLSYAWKRHPYMTIWITIGILLGIHTMITEMSIDNFVAAILTAFLPLILRGAVRALRSLDSWERTEIQMQKMREREAFKKYLKEYIEKL